MGRHGGGSRSGGGGSRSGGGGSSSSSKSGSRSGGVSRSRSSSSSSSGSYDRSYYDRHGRYHTYYTSNWNIGTRPGWTIGKIIALIFVTIHMIFMMSSFGFIQFGGKVEGDINRIKIVDTIDILTANEESEIIELFQEVYDESGMPITLYTDDFQWKEHYDSLEVYSEELYYQMGFDENAMIILFTTETDDGFIDWAYDMYCGDETIKCFSDKTFDKLLSNFQKAMASQDLAKALDYSWNSVMNDLGKTTFHMVSIPMFIFIVLFYSLFYIGIIKSAIKEQDIYKYYENRNII